MNCQEIQVVIAAMGYVKLPADAPYIALDLLECQMKVRPLAYLTAKLRVI